MYRSGRNISLIGPSIYLDNIARYVNKGGALLEAVGPTFATPLSLYRTPLGRVLPVEPSGAIFEQGYRPRITDLGLRHPVTAELSGAGEPGKAPTWVEVKPVKIEPIRVDVKSGTIIGTDIKVAPVKIDPIRVDVKSGTVIIPAIKVAPVDIKPIRVDVRDGTVIQVAPVKIKPIRVDVKSQPVKAIRLDAKDGTVIQLNSDDKVKPVIITSPVRLDVKIQSDVKPVIITTPVQIDVKIKSDVKAVIVSPKIKKTKADSDTKIIR